MKLTGKRSLMVKIVSSCGNNSSKYWPPFSLCFKDKPIRVANRKPNWWSREIKEKISEKRRCFKIFKGRSRGGRFGTLLRELGMNLTIQ